MQIICDSIRRRFRSRPHAAAGFTLVELLVVVAIIGTLVALLLPAVQAARAAARRTQCSSNMRQVGLAMAQFCDAHRGRFPDNSHTNATGSWIYTIAPFMEDVDEIRMCPDDKKRTERLAMKMTSYVPNAYLTDEPTGYPSRYIVTNLNKIQEPSKTLVAFEISDAKNVTSTDDHVHNHDWFTLSTVSRRTVFSEIIQDMAVDRHSGISHVLLADWRVTAIESALISDWASSQNRDNNFCLPGRFVIR